MSGYKLHPEAILDLDETRSYLAESDPDAADQFLDEIQDAIAKLAQFPDSGHKRPDLTSRDLRFIVVHDHLIAYAPVAVIHGRRNPRLLAATLLGRP